MHITEADYALLYKTCYDYPAIDNHAHPLLKLANRDVMTYENIISDSEGPALEDAIHTMACFRATSQLAKLFGLRGEGRDEVTWEQVKIDWIIWLPLSAGGNVLANRIE